MPRELGSKLATGLTRVESEALRCAEIEKEREDREFAAAYAAVRQRNIERCERELRLIRSLPQDYPDRAAYVALWEMDWRKEKHLVETEAPLIV